MSHLTSQFLSAEQLSRLRRSALILGGTLAAVFLVWRGVFADPPVTAVPHEVYAPQPAPQVQDEARSGRLSPPAVARTPGARGLTLPALSAEEETRLRPASGTRRALIVGVNREVWEHLGREIGERDLQWDVEADGSQTATLSVGSRGARALRTRLRFLGLPLGSRVDFVGSDGPEVRTLGSDEIARRQGAFWSPVTVGETQTIVIRIPPGGGWNQLRMVLDSVSHIASEQLPGTPRQSSDVGASGSCQQDVVCYETPLIRQMADSIAKLIFTENGGSYLCSGTLLNDTDSSGFVPYLYTAAHCIDSQAAADSVESYWFFESTLCGRDLPRAFAARYNGAVLLYTDAASDVSLLRLNDQPPTGAVFAGWSADPLNLFDEVIGIHHPSGDLKKISIGEFWRTGAPMFGAGSLFNVVSWISGASEGGSSGSGLFTTHQGSIYFRGGLWGGSSSCSFPWGDDYYSRLDLAFPSLTRYLAPTQVSPESGLWWNPSESGRGIFIEIDGGRLALAIYLYDASGRATWYSSSGPMNGPSGYSGQLATFAGGQTLTGGYRAPTFTGSVGEVAIQFTANDRGTLTWPGGTLAIERFSLPGASYAQTLRSRTGWWWNAAESGRGFGVEIQGDTVGIAAYMYDSEGRPVWYLADGALAGGSQFDGNWRLYAGGQAMGGAYQAPHVEDAAVGPVSLRFLTDSSALLTLPDGRTIVLTPFAF